MLYKYNSAIFNQHMAWLVLVNETSCSYITLCFKCQSYMKTPYYPYHSINEASYILQLVHLVAIYLSNLVHFTSLKLTKIKSSISIYHIYIHKILVCVHAYSTYTYCMGQNLGRVKLWWWIGCFRLLVRITWQTRSSYMC